MWKHVPWLYRYALLFNKSKSSNTAATEEYLSPAFFFSIRARSIGVLTTCTYVRKDGRISYVQSDGYSTYRWMDTVRADGWISYVQSDGYRTYRWMDIVRTGKSRGVTVDVCSDGYRAEFYTTTTSHCSIRFTRIEPQSVSIPLQRFGHHIEVIINITIFVHMMCMWLQASCGWG